MPVKMNIKPLHIQNKMLKAVKDGRPMLCSLILRDCNEYCKEDTGLLIVSSLVHSRFDKGLLIWRTPYAARQYYEIQTAHTDVNPNAVWRWVEHALSLHLDEWRRMAQAIPKLYGK